MTDKEKLLLNSLKYNVVNESKEDKHILTLSGVVAQPSFMNDETINSKLVQESLDDTNKDVVIRLNSPGGDVFEGIDIYNYLKSIKNHVTVEVTALAASAASIIAMAADKIVVRNGASIMIHEASTFAYGTKKDIQKTLNALSTIDKSIVDIYAERTGIDKVELQTLIENETWFTADEAIKKGFADEKSSEKAVSTPSDDKKGGEDMDKEKIAALLQNQSKILASIVENEGDDEESDKEKRLSQVEDAVADMKERLKTLESDDEEDEDHEEDNPEEPTNSLSRLFF